MRKLLYFLFAWLVLASCGKDKKEEDPTPNTPAATPAEAIAGLYTMNSLTSGGQTIPLPFSGNGTSISGTINVTTVSGKQDEASMTVTFKATGSPDETDVLVVQVRAAGSAYELLQGSQKLGAVDGNTLTLSDGAGTSIIAKK